MKLNQVESLHKKQMETKLRIAGEGISWHWYIFLG